MKKLQVICVAIVLAYLSGCASTFVPDSDVISQLPIVKMGSKKPEGKEYILHIPAGVKFPVHISVNGELISAPVDIKPVTQINQDIFIYKYWASLDGQNWQPTRDLVNMPIFIGVAPKGGRVDIKVGIIK